MSFKDFFPNWTPLESVFKSIFALICLTIAIILYRKNEQELINQNLDESDLEIVIKYCEPDVTSFKPEVRMIGAKYSNDRESGESKPSEKPSLTSNRDPADEPSVKVPEISKNQFEEEPSIHEGEEIQAVNPRREQVEKTLSPTKTAIQKELCRQRKRIPWYQKVIQELKEKTRLTGSKLTSYFLSKTSFPMRKIEMSPPQNWMKTK